jgi:hypothetical protein
MALHMNHAGDLHADTTQVVVEGFGAVSVNAHAYMPPSPRGFREDLL